jgi:uncharacterized C2H2 Zn-finger protein
MVSYKKKIEECYTKCSTCGRIFNNEKYDSKYINRIKDFSIIMKEYENFSNQFCHEI